MADPEFLPTKDGNLTCRVNGILLHSKYNPVLEGRRFAENIDCNYNPGCIIITEPGLFYCLEDLKKIFPEAQIIAVHYSEIIQEKSSFCTSVLVDSAEKAENLDMTLINLLGEEKICSALFLSWNASGNAFPEIDRIVWKKIKQTVELSRTLLATRTHFAEKWFINSLKILKSARNFFLTEKTDRPVVICASGPSLNGIIPFLKKYRNKFILAAVSSAIEPLTARELIPDFAISTDGGYWAEKHLYALRKYKNIPLVLAAEGAAPLRILSQNKIIPLTYDDGFSEKIFNNLKIKSFKGLRNGTVSGTALDFCKKLTSGSIFFCGLDLGSAKGLQHTGPNQIEIQNYTKDNRIITLEKRQAASRFNCSSLKIYQDWFKNLDESYCRNIFRLSDRFPFTNNLGNIKDVNADFFEARMSDCPDIKNEQTLVSSEYTFNKKRINELVSEFSKTSGWLREFFTVDFISLEKEISPEKKIEIQENLKKKNEKLLKRIRKVLA